MERWPLGRVESQRVINNADALCAGSHRSLRRVLQTCVALAKEILPPAVGTMKSEVSTVPHATLPQGRSEGRGDAAGREAAGEAGWQRQGRKESSTAWKNNGEGRQMKGFQRAKPHAFSKEEKAVLEALVSVSWERQRRGALKSLYRGCGWGVAGPVPSTAFTSFTILPNSKGERWPFPWRQRVLCKPEAVGTMTVTEASNRFLMPGIIH